MRTVVEHHRWKVLVLLMAWMLLSGAAAVAQGNPAADADALGPAFEVAAIRPANSDNRRWVGIKLDPSGRFEASQVTLNFLFWQAYWDAPGKRTVITDHEAPKWVDSEAFDVNAKVDDAYMGGWDKLSDQQRMDRVRPMLRRLLADRFHVKLRVEMRKTPVYVLVQAKGGAHVKEVPAPVRLEGDPTETMRRWMAEHPGQGIPGQILCGGERCTANAVKISNAIGQISTSADADRTVIDGTGLKGFYDFSFGQPHDPDESPMQAVEDDLGMRFEPRSMQIKTYVIESAEMPSVDGS